MQLAPIVTRLQGIPDFSNRVFAARDLKTAVEYARTRAGGSPSCVVFAPNERAGTNGARVGRLVVQEVSLRFGVMICVTYAGNAEKAFAELDQIGASVRETLLGWVMATGYEPMEVIGGQLSFSDIGLLIWGYEFRTQYTVRTST